MLCLMTAVASTLVPAREYGIFMGLQYYGPPLKLSTYKRVADAGRRVPLFVSVCADHNDTNGGAEHRRPGGDPGDGGRITPICDLGDEQGVAVRAGLSVLRQAGVHVMHYTHTRISNFPNGTEEKCCECCEDLDYVVERTSNETRHFPDDGIFTDNAIANTKWLPYYQAIAAAARKGAGPTRRTATNPNCAHAHTERCSPFCTKYGHSAEMCADCSSSYCEGLTADWLEVADVHILSEATVGEDTPHMFELRLPFSPTDAQMSKFSMFTYNATRTQWKPLIDKAKAAGFSKFWVDGERGGNRTSFVELPPWFEEMVEVSVAPLIAFPPLTRRSFGSSTHAPLIRAIAR
jgi:hypothetical protein